MAEIRRLRIDEAPLVRELVRLAIDDMARTYPEDDVGISERGLANLETQFRIGAVHEDELTAVAVDGDKIVGFVCAWITRGRATPGISGEIDWLWARRDSMRPEIASSRATPSRGYASVVLVRSSRWTTSIIRAASSGRASGSLRT